MTARTIAKALSGERFSMEEVRDSDGGITGLCIHAQWPFAEELSKLVRDWMIVNGPKVAREAKVKYASEQERDAAQQGFRAYQLQAIQRKAYEDAAAKPEGKAS